MTTTADYRAGSRAMMAQSRDELAQGDLQQASESGLGRHRPDDEGPGRKPRLGARPAPAPPPDRQPPAAEAGDREIYRAFAIASTLHENFYENQMTAQDIAEALDDVEGLLEKLEQIMSI